MKLKILPLKKTYKNRVAKIRYSIFVLLTFNQKLIKANCEYQNN